MAWNTLDHYVEPLPASGTDRQLVDGAAIKVEGQLRTAEVSRLDEAGAPEADLLLNGKQQGQRWVVELLPQDLQSSGQHRCAARTVISPQSSCRVAAFHHASFDHRLGALANRDGIHVGHQQPAGSGNRSRQLDDQVAAVALQWCLGVGLVE